MPKTNNGSIKEQPKLADNKKQERKVKTKKLSDALRKNLLRRKNK